MEAVQQYSETELVYLLKQRSESAFSYLYDNYAQSLNAVILNIVPDHDLVQDVLQEVFVKIWKQIESYDAQKGRLFTWMLNIARNAAIDLVRSKGYRKQQQSGELTDRNAESAGSSQVATDHIGLRKLVYQLKEEQRILVELAYFQGYTQDEIAQLLNIPLGTVKTRLRAALTQLRSSIKA
ncbi:MAG: RNA polymerase sigma factor [Chitinophagaceae bacterium]